MGLPSPSSATVMVAQDFPNVRRPVHRLKKAMYGHPDAGTYSEENLAHVCSR